MKIAIIGYGRMGKVIEKIAVERGHEIVMKISSKNKNELSVNKLKSCGAELAIEFTNPHSALENIKKCFEAKVKVVSGSTAWLDDWDEAIDCMKANEGSFIYASNFSIGVNIFFELNKQLAKMMDHQEDYNVSINEVHHTGKLDAPSGTALTLAQGIMENLKRKSSWSKEDPEENEILVSSVRQDPAPGTHEIKYTSEIDEIEIIHTAKSRKGFAIGAVAAAEYLEDKTGLWRMKDVLGL